MTFDEVRVALGLAPFGGVDEMRGRPKSGRTTFLLVDAVAAASQGHTVALLGASFTDTAMLIVRARALARSIGVPADDAERLIRAKRVPKGAVATASQGEHLLFIDHTVFEAHARRHRAPPPRAS